MIRLTKCEGEKNDCQRQNFDRLSNQDGHSMECIQSNPIGQRDRYKRTPKSRLEISALFLANHDVPVKCATIYWKRRMRYINHTNMAVYVTVCECSLLYILYAKIHNMFD